MSLDTFFSQYMSWLSLPQVGVVDIIEIIVIAYIVYRIMLWIQSTKTWNLLRGFLVLLLTYVVANVFQMTTITWILDKTLSIGVLALVILFQPELRKALEQLGNQNMFSAVSLFGEGRGKNGAFDMKTAEELIRSAMAMGKNKTGALIVIERTDPMTEYEKTGIVVDGIVSSQLLINLFEHNTPMHDGAVVIRGNRITSATCYLPLSDNMAISKDLGTRHRAGLGISEVSDSLTIIVSEETGAVSAAFEGDLFRRLSEGELRSLLIEKMIGQAEGKRVSRKGRHRG